VLDWIGREGTPPTPPLNMVGDYGGGGLYLALGMLAALLEARTSGHGQVVDAAIVDGTASLATSLFGMHAAGMLGERGTNILDSGAPFYEVYQCADNKWISIAPIEQKFYDELLKRLDIDPAALGKQGERADWRHAKQVFAEKFRTRTRDEWCALLEGSDACFAPVLTADEAPRHPHLAARGTFVEVEGVMQPAPAPRFSRNQCASPQPPAQASQESSIAALQEWLGEEAQQWRGELRFG
jgi:alpha-methylacyl-CoA racemase